MRYIIEYPVDSHTRFTEVFSDPKLVMPTAKEMAKLYGWARIHKLTETHFYKQGLVDSLGW